MPNSSEPHLQPACVTLGQLRHKGENSFPQSQAYDMETVILDCQASR